MVKRVINGKAYNTDTATRIDDNLHTAHPGDVPEVAKILYRTKHATFFLVISNQYIERDDIKPLSEEEARKWCENNNTDLDVMERHFGEFPEAGVSEMRTTLRMPSTLYEEASALAAAKDESLNTYIMRLLERERDAARQKKSGE